MNIFPFLDFGNFNKDGMGFSLSWSFHFFEKWEPNLRKTTFPKSGKSKFF